MTAITIDKDKAIELLEKQVEKKGADYVYKEEFSVCEYFSVGPYGYKGDGEAPKIGSPLCIVGHVYADLGLTNDDLYQNIYGAQVHNPYGDMSEVFPDPEKVVLTEDARVALHEAQFVQDTGGTWGRALAAAKEVIA